MLLNKTVCAIAFLLSGSVAFSQNSLDSLQLLDEATVTANRYKDLGKFSLDNIEEISLYNGQKSEIFQSAKEFGSAGSIYLTTRRPKFEDNKNTNFKAGIRTSSFDLFNPSILYEHKLGDKITTTFNAETATSTPPAWKEV
jgi:hypothetical protein